MISPWSCNSKEFFSFSWVCSWSTNPIKDNSRPHRFLIQVDSNIFYYFYLLFFVMPESICSSYVEALVLVGLKQVDGICPDCSNSVSKHQRDPKTRPCNFFLEELLGFGLDLLAGKCPSCNCPVGIHSRQSNNSFRWTLSLLQMR